MDKIIGKNLKKLRNEYGYTQKQVSDYLKISQSELSKIENGEKNMNMTQFENLCLLYNCTSDYLFGETDVYDKISIYCDGEVDLNAIAKMNQVVGYLNLLRKLESENDKINQRGSSKFKI